MINVLRRLKIILYQLINMYLKKLLDSLKSHPKYPKLPHYSSLNCSKIQSAKFLRRDFHGVKLHIVCH